MNETPDNLKVESLISRSLDGPLDAREQAQLDRMLRQEPSLVEEACRYRALEDHLRAMRGAGLERADFAAQRAAILAGIERRALLAPRRRVFLLRPVVIGAMAAAAAIAIAATIAVRVLMPMNPPQATVNVRVLPAERAPAGPAIVQAALAPQAAETPPSMRLPPPAFGLPPGTVMASFAPASPELSAAELLLPFMTFNGEAGT